MTTEPEETADTHEAFNPASPWFGAMVCPVAEIVVKEAPHGE
jgi:hypothetical protein